jgi:hypothetical protein
LIPLEFLSQKVKARIGDWPLGNPLFADPRYLPSRLSLANFHLFDVDQEPRRVCYVDGGNSTIIDSPSLAVSLNRVGFCIYEGEEKVRNSVLPSSIDFFSVTYANYEDDELNYHVEMIPVSEDNGHILPDETDLVFSSFDRSLMDGRRRASPVRVASASRVFAEWRYAGEIIKSELEGGDILVMDGSLQTQITGESKHSNRAYQEAVEKDVLFCGLSKTSTLFTDTGMPLLSSIAILANRNNLENERWYYYPIVEINAPDHRAIMFAVKLHPSSRYVFRLEILKDLGEEMDDFRRVFSLLAQNAVDLTFPGYPYGLMEADKISRVSEGEVESLRIQLLSGVSGLGIWKELEAFLRTVDAHQVLDGVRGF